MKTCSKCGEAKELAAFSKCASSKDGLQSRCKACRAEYGRTYYAANAVAIRAVHRDYYKTTADAKRAYNEAHKHPCVVPGCAAIVDKRSTYCKPHAGLAQRNQDLTPEQLATKEPASYNKLQLAAWSKRVRARDGACYDCGSTRKLHAHHVLPKAQNPTLAYFDWNGITLCEPCHMRTHHGPRAEVK